MELERYFEAAAFLLAAAAAGWAAAACRRAGRSGRVGADARVWGAVALLFLVLAVSRVAQLGTLLGVELRVLARGAGVYGRRRAYQIAATVGLAAFAVAAMTIGLRTIWDVLKRYRLAAGCVTVVIASALIRFVSLHEVDAWNARWPWVRITVDLATSAVAVAAAVARARQAG